MDVSTPKDFLAKSRDARTRTKRARLRDLAQQSVDRGGRHRRSWAPTWRGHVPTSGAVFQKSDPKVGSRYMRNIALIAAGVAGFAAAARSSPPPFFQILQPHGKIIDVNGYHLDLGDADDAAPPGAWQGPIRISRAGRSACTVSNEVSIIEPPIRLARHDILYVSTFSGRENRIYAIDAENCAVRWTSPAFTGQSSTARRSLVLPGAGTFPIGLDAVPQPMAVRDIG